MRTREEIMKIKEAFAYALMDMLDISDELLATGRVYIEDEPTVNDLAKNQDESNAKIIVDDTDTNRGDTYVR